MSMESLHPASTTTYLFPTDFSNPSLYAIQWGLSFLRFNADDTVLLCAVVQPPSRAVQRDEYDQVDAENSTKAELEVLEKTFRKELRGVNVEFYVESAEDPKQAIVALTKTRADIATVIMGSHGKAGGREVGSVSQYLLKHSHVPVIVVAEPHSSK